jgi:hypothetical protein
MHSFLRELALFCNLSRFCQKSTENDSVCAVSLVQQWNSIWNDTFLRQRSRFFRRILISLEIKLWRPYVRNSCLRLWDTQLWGTLIVDLISMKQMIGSIAFINLASPGSSLTTVSWINAKTYIRCHFLRESAFSCNCAECPKVTRSEIWRVGRMRSSYQSFEYHFPI